MTQMATSREQQKAETRQHIQAVAKRLMMERGFERTTMRDLAKAAGISVGTIALHFKDKKSLLLATFYEEVSEVARGAIESVPDGLPLRDTIEHILRREYRFYADDTGYLRNVVKETLFVRGEWMESFDALRHEMVLRLVALIEEAQARGEVKPDVDCHGVTMVLWSLYLSGLIEGFKQQAFDADTMVEMVMQLVDVVLYGVLDEV